MENFFLTLQIATMIMPLVMQTVQTFEMPGATGQQKFDAVFGAVTLALESLPEPIKAKIDRNGTATFIKGLIPVVVMFLNASGVFSHKAK